MIDLLPLGAFLLGFIVVAGLLVLLAVLLDGERR
jgi:hypothetical protein